MASDKSNNSQHLLRQESEKLMIETEGHAEDQMHNKKDIDSVIKSLSKERKAHSESYRHAQQLDLKYIETQKNVDNLRDEMQRIKEGIAVMDSDMEAKRKRILTLTDMLTQAQNDSESSKRKLVTLRADLENNKNTFQTGKYDNA